MTRNIEPLISDAEWMAYVMDFIFSVMAAADAGQPTLYASRIDVYLMPFEGRGK